MWVGAGNKECLFALQEGLDGWMGSALRWISRRFVKCKMGFSTTKKGKNFGRVQMDVMMVEFKEVGKICKSWPARGRCEIWGTLVMRLKRIKLNCSAKSMKHLFAIALEKTHSNTNLTISILKVPPMSFIWGMHAQNMYLCL